jgi:cobalt-zinc-cadmium efflux system outer membrane protein
MHTFGRSCAVVALAGVAAAQASAQSRPDTLSLQRARAAGRAVSAELAAAQAALDVARGRVRQAGAFPNPVLSYNREQTGASGASTSQDVIAVDQAIENPSLRSARGDAARFRARAAEARVRAAEADVDLEVTRAWARSQASARRAGLADQAARAFGAAMTTSERRLQEGDISGFAARRIRLEAARYAALRAEAVLESRTANLALGVRTGLPVDSSTVLLPPSLNDQMLQPADTLIVTALLSRADLAAASAEVDAARADARISEGERFPAATLTLGSKTEQPVAGERLSGFVAGIALPLPLWDRRGGATEAQVSEARRRYVEWGGLRRAVGREVQEATMALRAVQEQLRLLGPTLQADARSALRAAQVAYSEGELTLLEWLDTVRAYYETETSIANLQAELLVRAAALERAVGTNVFPELR